MPRNSSLVFCLSLLAFFSFGGPPNLHCEESVLLKLLQASEAVVSIRAQTGVVFGDVPQKYLIQETGEIVTRHRFRPVIHDRFGTGVVIHDSGFIVTNAHIVYKSGIVTVTTADGVSQRAVIVKASPEEDLAILKIEPATPLPFVPLGDSSEVKLSEKVYSIGGSELLKNTISEGTIRALGYTYSGKTDPSQLIGLIQVDFDIYGGDSGTPLINRRGSLIGIFAAADTKKGKRAYAIPSNKITRMLREITEKGPSN